VGDTLIAGMREFCSLPIAGVSVGIVANSHSLQA
jgi:hypothetical protein